MIGITEISAIVAAVGVLRARNTKRRIRTTTTQKNCTETLIFEHQPKKLGINE